MGKGGLVSETRVDADFTSVRVVKVFGEPSASTMKIQEACENSDQILTLAPDSSLRWYRIAF